MLELWLMLHCCNRACAGAAAMLTVLLFSAPAAAHHAIQEIGVGHPQPQTFVGVDFAVAGFDLSGQRGDYYDLVPNAEYAPWEYLSVGLRLPVYFLELDKQDLRVGIGDLDTVVKLRLYHHPQEKFVLTAGLGGEFPTGDQDRGLGAGDVDLAPFLTAMGMLGPLMLHGTVGVNVAVVKAGAPSSGVEPTNYVSPHSDFELVYHLGLLHWFYERFFANFVVSLNTVLASENRGDTFTVLVPELGVLATRALQVSVRPEIPVAGDRRFEWKLSLNLLWRFGEEAEALGDHTHEEDSGK